MQQTLWAASWDPSTLVLMSKALWMSVSQLMPE